jgi:hypothetical protein
MSAASAKKKKKRIVPKVEILKNIFLESYGREMTSEEERLLLWAEKIAPSFSEDDPNESA